MVITDKLTTALRELSDELFQTRAWLTPCGPVASSFTEQICQTFDDTGLSDALDAGRCPTELTEESFSVLRALDEAARRVDESLPPKELLKNAQVKEVRALARRALDLLEAK